MKPSLLCVLFACTCSCSPPSSQNAKSAPPAAEQRLPSSTYSWGFVNEGSHATLTYGIPETDNVLATFECNRNTGRAQIVAIDPERSGRRLIITSNAKTVVYRAQRIYNDPNESIYSRAMVSTSEDVLNSFRNGSNISFGRERVDLPVRTSAEREAVSSFFTYCH